MKPVEKDLVSIQISVRVEPDMVDRADELVTHMSARTGRIGKRSDVWREALIVGLRELERQLPQTQARVRGSR